MMLDRFCPTMFFRYDVTSATVPLDVLVMYDSDYNNMMNGQPSSYLVVYSQIGITVSLRVNLRYCR
jgi:hypothetical protein